MILLDMLMPCHCDQKFYIYVTNAYDENLPIYKGEKQQIFNGDRQGSCYELFDHLHDKVDLYEVCSKGGIQISVIDEHFDQRVQDWWSSDPKETEKWNDSDPMSRPWLFSCETEAERGETK